MTSRLPLLGPGHLRILDYLAGLRLSAEGLPSYGATVNGIMEAGHGVRGRSAYDKVNRLLDAGLVRVMEAHTVGGPKEGPVQRRAFIVTSAGRKYLALCRELWPEAFASQPTVGNFARNSQCPASDASRTQEVSR